jgi:type IV secretory pathway VirJ component
MSLKTEDYVASSARQPRFALVVSGDGPIPSFARGLARAFVKAGVSAAVIRSAHYFWRRRTPEEFARHLEERLEEQLRRHDGDRFVLVGYSFGGAALPFAVRLLPQDLAERIDLVVLAAPATRADFEFQFISWLNISSRDSLDASAELGRMIAEGVPALLVYGKRDFKRARPAAPGADIIELPGGHDLGKDYDGIVAEIEDRLGQVTGPNNV